MIRRDRADPHAVRIHREIYQLDLIDGRLLREWIPLPILIGKDAQAGASVQGMGLQVGPYRIHGPEDNFAIWGQLQLLITDIHHLAFAIQ